jgi:FG-GAP-like repeat/FG-GAP repeat
MVTVTLHTGVHLNTTVLVVAVADFNGDGKPDVYVGNAIFFGNGDGTFRAPVTVTGILGFWAVDLNGDGKADLLGFSQDGHQLLVYVGNGDGKFVSEMPCSLGATYFTPSLVFGDFNSDHKTDVAVLCGACLQPQGVVLLGSGDGTFPSTPIPWAVPTSSSSTVAGDFNGEGSWTSQLQAD